MAKRPPTPPPEATLSALVRWLESEEVEGLIIGGIAASLLGRPRLTRDVDVLKNLIIMKAVAHRPQDMADIKA